MNYKADIATNFLCFGMPPIISWCVGIFCLNRLAKKGVGAFYDDKNAVTSRSSCEKVGLWQKES